MAFRRQLFKTLISSSTLIFGATRVGIFGSAIEDNTQQNIIGYCHEKHAFFNKTGILVLYKENKAYVITRYYIRPVIQKNKKVVI